MMAADFKEKRKVTGGLVCLGWRNGSAKAVAQFESNRRLIAVPELNFDCRTPRQRRSQVIRILIADDHGIVRTGLKLLFERVDDMQVVGEAADGREAARLAKELQPDIVILDIGMPLLNGLDAAAQTIRENENIGVIILSMH